MEGQAAAAQCRDVDDAPSAAARDPARAGTRSRTSPPTCASGTLRRAGRLPCCSDVEAVLGVSGPAVLDPLQVVNRQLVDEAHDDVGLAVQRSLAPDPSGGHCRRHRSACRRSGGYRRRRAGRSPWSTKTRWPTRRSSSARGRQRLAGAPPAEIGEKGRRITPGKEGVVAGRHAATAGNRAASGVRRRMCSTADWTSWRR